MAKKKEVVEETTEEVVEKTVEAEETKVRNPLAEDPVYTVEELAACAKSKFSTNPYTVMAAMSYYGLTKCTLEEAKRIIDSFKSIRIK